MYDVAIFEAANVVGDGVSKIDSVVDREIENDSIVGDTATVNDDVLPPSEVNEDATDDDITLEDVEIASSVDERCVPLLAEVIEFRLVDDIVLESMEDAMTVAGSVVLALSEGVERWIDVDSALERLEDAMSVDEKVVFELADMVIGNDDDASISEDVKFVASFDLEEDSKPFETRGDVIDDVCSLEVVSIAEVIGVVEVTRFSELVRGTINDVFVLVDVRDVARVGISVVEEDGFDC